MLTKEKGKQHKTNIHTADQPKTNHPKIQNRLRYKNYIDQQFSLQVTQTSLVYENIHIVIANDLQPYMA